MRKTAKEKGAGEREKVSMRREKGRLGAECLWRVPLRTFLRSLGRSWQPPRSPPPGHQASSPTAPLALVHLPHSAPFSFRASL